MVRWGLELQRARELELRRALLELEKQPGLELRRQVRVQQRLLHRR